MVSWGRGYKARPAGHLRLEIKFYLARAQSLPVFRPKLASRCASESTQLSFLQPKIRLKIFLLVFTCSLDLFSHRLMVLYDSLVRVNLQFWYFFKKSRPAILNLGCEKGLLGGAKYFAKLYNLCCFGP